MAICDSQCKFILIDIGATGRQSDGGIWSRSAMGRAFLNGDLNIPFPEHVTEGPILPYVLVGDEAFQLTNFMMRPYPGKGGLTKEKQIFNYRLSRARRMIECTFGLLASQWRIFRRPINTSIKTAINIVKATIVLHNLLRENNNNITTLSEIACCDIHSPTTALRNINSIGSNTNTQEACRIRNIFTDYFNNEGAVSWQENNL